MYLSEVKVSRCEVRKVWPKKPRYKKPDGKKFSGGKNLDISDFKRETFPYQS